MPDLLLLVSAEDAGVLKMHIEKIGDRLRSTTARAFTDLGGDSNKIALYVIEYNSGSNTPPLQIIGIASFSWKRLFQLRKWKENLADVWGFLYEEEPRLKDTFGIEKVEVWPMLVPGLWGLVAPIFYHRH